jgi:hypothetical protein
MKGDFHVRFCERLKLKCFGLLDRMSIQLKIAILLLWLIETDFFQLPQLHKHFNVGGKHIWTHLKIL